MNNIKISELLESALKNIDGEIEQLNISNSIYPYGTYKISKLFKNASNYEIEAWSNNIISKLSTCKDLEKNCSCNFRIYNDGNEKWNNGLLFVWVKEEVKQ